MLSRIESFRPDEVAVALELIDDAINRPESSGYHAIVAEDGGGLSGYVCFGPTPMTQGTWDLYWIAVDPEAQGRGTGKLLVAALEGLLRERSARIVRIETSSQDAYDGTLAFYERTGFILAGRIPDFYAPGDDILFYYKRLG